MILKKELIIAMLIFAKIAFSEEWYTMTWPDLATVNSTKNVFVLSLGGAGGGTMSSFANDFQNTGAVVVTGTPKLEISADQIMSNSVYLTEQFYKPTTVELAQKIKQYIEKMNPSAKVILIGKSMGGALLTKAMDQLNAISLKKVDLFVTVDPNSQLGCVKGCLEPPPPGYTCSTCPDGVGCERNTYRTLPVNVLKAYNYYQEKCHETGVCLYVKAPLPLPVIPVVLPPFGITVSGVPYLIVTHQCGSKISNSSDPKLIRQNINANKSGLCSGVDHKTIEDCAGLKDAITVLVKKEIGEEMGKLISPVIENLLQN